MNTVEHLDFINELLPEEEGFMTFIDTPVKDEEEVEMRKTQPITYKIHGDIVIREDKVGTPVQKEAIAPVRDFINSKKKLLRQMRHIQHSIPYLRRLRHVRKNDLGKKHQDKIYSESVCHNEERRSVRKRAVHTSTDYAREDSLRERAPSAKQRTETKHKIF